MNDLDAFARLVDALRPWLGQMVLVGGWAHRVHRLSSLAHAPAYQPVLTLDADLAFPAAEAFEGSVGSALKSAGFAERFLGEHTPPVSRYTLGSEGSGFYAEFLTPLKGSGLRRDGRPDVTLSKSGVTAQKLRYVDILLIAPMRVRLARESGFPVEAPAEVRVVNPVSFVTQKLLIQPERPPEKRAQDLLYIHDTIELFGGGLEELADLWKSEIRPNLAPATARKLQRQWTKQFDAVDDVIRSAVRIPQDRSLAPETFRAVCAYGLEEIFGR